MDYKVEVNRLEKDELTYELAIRGYTSTEATKVEDMRRMLRNFLKLERSGSKLTYPQYPYTFKEDVDYVKTKIKVIKDLVKDFADTDTSSQYLKIISKLFHTFKRAERCPSDSDDEHAQRSQLLVELIGLESVLKSRVRRFKRASQSDRSPVELSVLLSSTGIDSESSDESDFESPVVASDSATATTSINNVPVPHCKSIPVAKWNITKFDGSNTKLSLGAFLENIEELRISRNVTQEQLFNSASDLFIGKALVWFRSIRSKIKSWEELVGELRLQFQVANFNERLFEEIKKRTQGSDESMGIYIAVMTNMFNRLTTSVSEAVKLRILLRNIAPFYQSQLGLTKVDSIDHLLRLGRDLEARKESIDNFVPPPRDRRTLMEPDLAYVYAESTSSGSGSKSGVIDEIICWNCKSQGHRASACVSSQKNRYCFRCGQPGSTVRTCNKCNQPKNGNGNP